MIQDTKTKVYNLEGATSYFISFHSGPNSAVNYLRSFKGTTKSDFERPICNLLQRSVIDFRGNYDSIKYFLIFRSGVWEDWAKYYKNWQELYEEVGQPGWSFSEEIIQNIEYEYGKAVLVIVSSDGVFHYNPKQDVVSWYHRVGPFKDRRKWTDEVGFSVHQFPLVDPI